MHTAAVAAFATRRPGQATDEVVVIFEPDGALPQDIPRMAEIVHNATALVARRQGLRLAFVLPVESGSLPRTSIGKIQRKTLKDAFENGAPFSNASFNVLRWIFPIDVRGREPLSTGKTKASRNP